MRADGGVEAVVGNDEAFDGTAADEVLADDLGNVFDPDPAVPNGFGVDDDGGAMLALLKDPDLLTRTRGTRPAAFAASLRAAWSSPLPSVVQEGRALPGSRTLVQTKTWRSNFANRDSLE